MSLPLESSTATAPKVTDHTFYLWDDTDEVTRALCGIGCAFGPEDHISPEAFAAAQRVRDAAPELYAELKWAVDWMNAYEGMVMSEWREWADRAGAVLAAAAPSETGGAS